MNSGFFPGKKFQIGMVFFLTAALLPGCRILIRKNPNERTDPSRGGYLTRVQPAQLMPSNPENQTSTADNNSSSVTDHNSQAENTLSKEALINRMEDLKQQLAEVKKEKEQISTELSDIKSGYGKKVFQLETSVEREKKEGQLTKEELVREKFKALKAQEEFNRIQLDLLSKKAVFDSHYPAYYDVVKGDSLWKIAAKENIYGNPYKWIELYHENQGKLTNQDVLYPGMVLKIPRYIEMMMQGMSMQPQQETTGEEKNNVASVSAPETKTDRESGEDEVDEDPQV
jgi:hypothetical protein